MSVTSHLKDLLTKMGGTPKDGDSTSVLIDKIEDVYNGAGGGGSSSDDFVIKIYADTAVDSETDSKVLATLRLDKTLREISEALQSRRTMYCYYDIPLWNEKFEADAAENQLDTTIPIFVPKTNNSERLVTGEHTYYGERNGILFTEQYASQYLSSSPIDISSHPACSLPITCAQIRHALPEYGDPGTLVFIFAQNSVAGALLGQKYFYCNDLDDYPFVQYNLSI